MISCNLSPLFRAYLPLRILRGTSCKIWWRAGTCRKAATKLIDLDKTTQASCHRRTSGVQNAKIYTLNLIVRKGAIKPVLCTAHSAG